MKEQHPELNLYKKRIRLKIAEIKFRLERIPKYIDSEPEGYLMQSIRWMIEDLEKEIKEDIKRYYKLKQYNK
jgi:hypothetical protein